MRIKVIITAIGSPAGASVVKLINKEEYEVFGLDTNKNVHNKNDVDHFIVVPRISDESYLEQLKHIIQKEKIQIFIPTIQPDLNYINEIREIVKVITTNKESLDICLDKAKLYETLEQNNLNQYVPMFKKTKVEDFINSNNIDFTKPYIIKPNTEHGGQSFKQIIVTDKDEVSKMYSKGNLYVKTLEETKIILRDMLTKEILISEFLYAPELSVDTLFFGNDELIAIPRKRTIITGGIVKSGEVYKDLEVVKAIKKINKILKLENFVNIQFMYDNRKQLKIIDINPRFCGSFIMSYGAGVNFVNLTLDNINNKTFKLPKIEWNKKFARFWDEYFYD